MTWCNNNNTINNTITNIPIISEKSSNNQTIVSPSPSLCSSSSKIIKIHELRTVACPSCGHHVPLQDQAGGINELPGLPAGVKFDPSDPEVLGHLEAKVKSDLGKLHPLLDEFIPTIEGENGICYTHPEKLPGVCKDGVMRHFFHRPSKAYTTGTRKRRKVHTDEDGGETRWHKTGKTRPILVNGVVKGFKKILVLYTNYGRQKKPEKTNWVMHQYHLGEIEEEKDGEFVLSKVFYQTQPRQCGSTIKEQHLIDEQHVQNHHPLIKGPINFYHPSNFITYDHVVGEQNRESSPQLIPNLVVQGDGSSFVQLGARK